MRNTEPDVKWIERGNRCLAQQSTGTNSKRHTAYVSSVPSHISRGEKCYLFDAWGNRYIDFVGGLGTNLLGYNHPKVMEAVQKALTLGGPSFSLPHTLEIEVAEKIQRLIPIAEKVRFLKNGDDATMAAIRIARTHGHSSAVVSHGYHGRSDLWTSLTPPALGVTDKFEISREGPGIYICEPLELDDGQERRNPLGRTMGDHEIVIFDEIITGFRVPDYCVANWWNMSPDIICLGKAIANGFPLSVVAGKKEVMDCGEYFISSTFSGEIMSLAACNAVLDELPKHSLKDLMFYGKRFQERFNRLMEGLIQIQGYGTRGMIPMETESEWLVQQEAARSGILLGKAFFYSFAIMEEEVEEYVLNILSDIASRVKRKQVTLQGNPPCQTFKR